MLKRRFADLSQGQVHYRTGGTGGPAPLVLLHGGASNGAALSPLAAALAATRLVVVPDLPGCGDSDPLPMAQAEIADFADMLAALLDALGLARCDLHGAHLGARVATEMALRHPRRVRRVILDGCGFYDEAERQVMLDHVAPPVLPDAEGSYLLAAHAMCRDYFRYFPWFRRDEAHRRAGPEPGAAVLHARLVELLRNGASYSVPYHAALRYRMEDALPRLTLPVLLATATTDNVFPQRGRAAALVPTAATAETPGTGSAEAIVATAAIFASFLDGVFVPR